MFNIVAMECMERFAYYGFRAVLTLYLSERLGFKASLAVSIFAFSSALAYSTPIVGGWLADGVIGKYATIKWLGSVYVVGLWVLVASAALSSIGGSVLALGLIGIGTGGIKPCVSAFGADQFRGASEDDPAVRRYFAVFYASINVGSVVSFVVTPLMRSQLGYAAAFAVPATLMVLALCSFVAARDSYVREPRASGDTVNLCTTLKLVVASDRHTEDDDASSDTSDIVALRRVFGIFATLPIFWMLYDQQGSVWVMQAKDMRTFGGAIQPEQIGVVNPILILVLLPFFEKVAYPQLEKRTGSVSPTLRMAAGMAFAAGSFFVAASLESALPTNILWQIPQIFLISVGEVLVSATGLEYAYTHAPLKYKSTCTSAFLLTTAVGDICGGILYAAVGDAASRGTIMLGCASLMLATLALFVRVATALTGQPVFGAVATVDDDHICSHAVGRDTKEDLPVKNALHARPSSPTASL